MMKGKRNRAEERSKEQGLHRTRLECRILGAVSLILASVLAFQNIRPVSENSVQVAAYSAAEAYESSQTMNQDSDFLILVNKDHPLPEDYEVNLHWLNSGRCAVADEIYGALKDMLEDGTVNGRQFVVASGFRDRERQEELLEEDIQTAMERDGLTRQEAYDQETRETMPPGYSEHETGLAVDIVSLDYQVLDEGQETTAENQWLRENCSKYGFILRYPKGKGDITGIDYEAWHFRYVGVDAAEEIMRRGITLEEYLEEKK